MIAHISFPIYHCPYIIAHICTTIYDHTGDLFDRSLQAELRKQPQLLTLTTKDVAANPPKRLFRARLKGYFMCPELCRIWVLGTLRDARKRGEFFVKWTNAAGTNHDGTCVFAHFFTIRYLELHKPGMSVLFDREGAIKSTSVHVTAIRRCVWANRAALARRCHDMAKQMYNNKKYSREVWKPLHQWLFGAKTCTALRMKRLLAFGKADDDLHQLTANCLWTLANAANLPWGRSAVRPSEYSEVPITEKVVTSEYSHG